MYENLKRKYGITTEEIQAAVRQIKLGIIACSGPVLLAIVDLISSGDIAGDKPSEGINDD